MNKIKGSTLKAKPNEIRFHLLITTWFRSKSSPNLSLS